MADIALIRVEAGLVGATAADRDLIHAMKYGQTFHGAFKRMRNPGHHRKFFKLLDLAFDYWEPTGGLVGRQELRGIRGLAKYFEDLNGRPGQLSNATQAYIDKLTQERAEQYPAVDKSREAFLDWVVTESGHYILVTTPAGIERRRKSISWASMDQAEFDGLYRDVFNICWRMILQAHFATEADAMSAAEQLNQYA